MGFFPFFLLSFFLLFSCGFPSFAAGPAVGSKLCGTIANLSPVRTTHTLTDTGGKYLPAKGTLRVLLVFASFPDDETPHPYWPAHNPPLFMEQFLDPDTSTRSEGLFNLTNYFHQMSLGQFHFVGNVVWVEGVHSQEEYRNQSYGRANWAILQERVDPVVNFKDYDHWTRLSDYNHTNVPDGTVDMIIMVWRTTMFAYLGEASLGYKPTIVADSVRIEMGYPEHYPAPLGSGVTCEYPYGDTPRRVMQTIAHEVGHWLLGGPHPYNGLTLAGKRQFWGVLCAGERVSSCANAYERERLGWITVPTITPDHDIHLSDFVSTGAAYKYHPPEGEQFEYFYFENHQLISAFDDVTRNPDDKGIWILHQQGPYSELDNLRIRPSDGNWAWLSLGVSRACFSTPLPVFARGVPSIVAGESHRDQIPNTSSALNWMHVFRDPAGVTHCGAFFGGELFRGSFTSAEALIYSPYSNPATNTWTGTPTSFSIEVLGETGGRVTIRSNSDPLVGPPARRYLGLDPTVPTLENRLSLAWGAQWLSGQPLEADVTASELQRRIGDSGTWATLYTGPLTAWRDSSEVFDSSGTVQVQYRARVSDAQGKYSSWSNTFYARVATVSATSNRPSFDEPLPREFSLCQNFPNPFNPTTEIRFTIAAGRNEGPGIRGQGTEGGKAGYAVSLRVYDLLGREVAALVNESKAPGSYRATFNGSHLPSGVYLYRLTAGNWTGVRKMILAR